MDFEKIISSQGVNHGNSNERKKVSTQDIYKGQEGIDWEFGEDGFPRRIEQENSADAKTSSEIPNPDAQEKVDSEKVPQQSVSENVEGEAVEDLENLHNKVKVEWYEIQVNQALQEIVGGCEKLILALKDREENQLTPLLSQQQAAAVMANLRSLAESKVNLQPEEIQNVADTVNRIARLFQNFGPERGFPIRENPDSLKKVAYGARNLHDALELASRKLLSEEGEELGETIDVSKQNLLIAVRNLNESSGTIYNVAMKLHQIVSSR